MNLEGKLLGNRYEIIEKIGSGGMATVYRAKCHVLKRYVAVKVLRDEYTTDIEFIKRFNTEAESAASLVHPNIVSVYDVGKEGNLYYIVMELVKGKTLKEIIVEDGKMGWKWSVQIAKQIASALETAHRNNIIHRDIKPHNIIITEDGVAKVTDFGIAKAVSNSTITAFGSTIGSVHYFSPEHARGGMTDAKSDLYSLGVVLYEMLTGRVPFDSDTPVSVALKHMQEKPVEPIELNPAIPQSLNDIIMKAMQKDPLMRYQSATEMIRDLDKILKNPEFAVEKEVGVSPRVQKTDAGKHSDGKKKKGFAKIKDFLAKHKFARVALIALIFLIIFIVTIAITLGILSAGEVKDVLLPDFTGKTVDEAKQLAEQSKLNIMVQEEKYDVEIEEGKIISQDPKYQANFTVKEGRTINVTVSKGEKIVEMIKVLGEPKDDSVKKLKDLDLTVKFEEDYNDEWPEGTIIEQSVEEGEQIPAGTEIILKVSLGIEQVEVPDLKGMSEEEARNALTAAKLKLKRADKVKDSSQGNGVVEQSIAPKSMVNKGEEVEIKINTYTALVHGTATIDVASFVDYVKEYDEVTTTETDENGEEISVTKKVEKTPGNVNVVVSVDDVQVTSKSVRKDTKDFQAGFDGEGTVRIKVLIDGSQVAQRDLNLNESTIINIAK